jgi:hypothetical protein
MNFQNAVRTGCAVSLTIILGSSQVIAVRQRAASKIDRSSDEEEIRAVVLRSQMMEWAQGGDKSEKEAKDATDKEVSEQLNFKTFYVSVEGKDPSPGLMLKLANVPRVLKPVSESEIAKAVRMPVVDKKTHERGIIFYVDKIHWNLDSSVKVDGGYHCNGLCAAGVTFSVKRVDGSWIIKKSAMNWIS